MLSRGVANLCRMMLNQAKIPSLAATHKVPVRAISTTLPKFTTYYTEDHEWITVENEVGKVGITDFAQEQLGEIVYCELPDVGATFSQGDTMAVVESVKAASDLYSPVTGEVLEVNSPVVKDPNMINTFPTTEGWLIQMKLSDSSELKGLMNAEEYAKHTAG